MNFHIAQINIGRLIAPIDDAKIAGFVAQLDPINALADVAPGFVWRLQSASGNATDVPYNNDPSILVNMSVWESIEALCDYAYTSKHIAVFRDRAKWFEKMDKPHYHLWWVPAGHIPTVIEGRKRLEHFSRRGRLPTHFGFPNNFRRHCPNLLNPKNYLSTVSGEFFTSSKANWPQAAITSRPRE